MTKPTTIHKRVIALGKTGHVYLLTPTSEKIMKALSKSPVWISYDELRKATGVPKQTLYVFGGRLEKAGLVSKGTGTTPSGFNCPVYLRVAVPLAFISKTVRV